MCIRDSLVDGLAGDDVITGGRGNDTLRGGAGSDHYRFAVGEGSDLIVDDDVTACLLYTSRCV